MSTRRKSTGSHTVKKQLVYSMYHPQRSCSKCILCGKSAIHYTHFGVLGGDENDFIAQHLGRTLHLIVVCVRHTVLKQSCTSCRKDGSSWVQLQGVIFTHAYTPSVQQLVPQLKTCLPAFKEIDNLEAALCVESTPDHPFLVCPKHYQDARRTWTAGWSTPRSILEWG